MKAASGSSSRNTKSRSFYTAPTAIRAFIKWGDHHVKKHDLSSLRLLGTVGEGINPEAWMWYHRVIGRERCPIVDTWWQTETGGIMMSPLPGAIATKPGSCTKPLPGIIPAIVDPRGNPVGKNQGGWLVMTQPWPGMLRGIWGDDERYKEVYWSKVPGKYLAGDNARCDDDGYYWIMGRIDDVLNVSGHRLSTIEIESALVSHPKVAEAAAVGRPDELKGEAVAVFVTLREGEPNDALREELKKHVRHEIGALAQPDDIRFTGALPKTRSGKIMRRLLRDIAAGKETVGDTTTLEDYSVLAKIRGDEEYVFAFGSRERKKLPEVFLFSRHSHPLFWAPPPIRRLKGNKRDWGAVVRDQDRAVVFRACLAMMPLIVLGACFTHNWDNIVATVSLVLVAWLYSVPPIRLKERPPLDSIANGFGYFLLPFVMGYSLNADPREMPLRYFLLAFAFAACTLWPPPPTTKPTSPQATEPWRSRLAGGWPAQRPLRLFPLPGCSPISTARRFAFTSQSA